MPTITVTKDDGVPAATKKNAGDIVTYTNTITNSGTDATGVQFLDPDVAHAALSGTVKVSPIAFDDAYAATGNVSISVPVGSGVLSNDFMGLNPAATITASSTTSVNGGAVVVSADGSFTYSPPAGFTGTDTFTYTLSNVAGSSIGTVTVTVSNMIWFINNTVGAGTGTLASPFNTLAAFQAVNDGVGTHPKNGDVIFIYTGSGNYTGGVTLRTNQKLIGQGASLSGNMGFILASNSATLPGIGTNPTLANAGGAAITLGEGSSIYGTTVSNGTQTGIAGTVNTAVIDSASSITTTSGTAFSLGAGNGIIIVGAPITSGTGRSVAITGRTAGTVTLSGAITDTGTGISLTSNTGATINFTGGLSLSTTTNAAFTATGGGTVTASQNNTSIVNTITTTTGNGLVVTNTTIGASGLTFRSITAGTGAGSAGVGISLDTTGSSGGLTVTGNGSAGSGGTIQHKTGANLNRANGIGIYLNNTANVSLTRMQLNDFDNFAIRGFGVTGFTMANCVINGANGSSTANLGGTDEQGEGAVYFGNAGASNSDGLNGTVSITNSTIQGGSARNLSIADTSSAVSEMRATVSGCTFGLTQNISGGNQSLAVEARNSGTVSHVTVTSSTFAGSISDAMNFTGQTGTTMHVIVGGAGVGNTITNTHVGNVVGGGSMVFATQGIMFFDARNNTMSGANGSAITLFKASSGTQLEGTIDGNTIGTSGVADSGAKTGNGIYLSAGGAGAIKLAITNNIIQRYSGAFGISADNTGGSYSVDMTITGNTIRQPGPSAAAALGLTNGSPSSSDSTNVFARILNNDFADGDPLNSGDVYLAVSGSSSVAHTFTLSGAVAGDVASFAAIQTFIKNNNNLNGASTNTVVQAYNDPPATLSQFKASASLPASPTAPTPLLFAAGGIEQAPTTASGDPTESESIQVDPTSFTAAATTITPNVPAAKGLLTQAELDATVSAAIERWEATGLTSEQSARLRSMSFEVAALSSNHLGEASARAIRVDQNAGGNGWFIDASPESDALFGNATSPTRRYTVPTGAPAGRIDLLTTVMHEMGHALGLPDSYNLRDRNSIMFGQLTKGERRLPAKDEAKGATPFLGDSTHFLSGGNNPIVIGTLPAGKSVTIVYSVQIEDPILGGATKLSSQATVTGSNFASVLSDDPNVVGTADPTETLLAVPPTVTSSTAPLAINAATLVINGTGFDTTVISNNTVTFNNGAVGTVTAATATSITVTFSTPPSAVGSLTAIAATTSGNSGAAVQVATVIPAITASAGHIASNATSLVINGFGFSATPANNTVVLTGGTAGTVTAASTTQLTLNVSALSAGSLTATVAVAGNTSASAQVATVDAPVVISPTSLPDWTVNKSGYSQTITASGGFGSKTFAVTAGAAPTGMTLSTGGVLSGTPTATGTFNFTVTATDTINATGTQAYTIVINAAVSITTASLPDWTVNKTGYSQTIAATGGTGAKTFAVTLGAQPTGMTLSSGGVLSGTPTATGTFNFTVTATDTVGATSTQAYTVVINAAVTVSPSTLPDWTVNKTGYSQTISSTGGTGAKTFAVTVGALPTGLSLAAGGALTGTPTATGTFNFTVTATDTVGATGTQAYTVVINAAVTVSPSTLPDWTVNKTGYSQTVTSANGTGAKSLSITAGAIPTGMTFTAGTGVLNGTPTATGTFNFTVTATDSVGATGSQAYTIIINAAVSITTTTLPNATLNIAGYSQTIAATGGTGAKTFAVTLGSVPTGMTLSSGGVLSGTPTATGTFNFTVTATDTVGATGTQTLSVTVVNITLTPNTLPDWTVNKSGYSQTLTGNNGTAPYTFAVTLGSVPTGLTLSTGGVLSGTPTATGTFNFTVTATDNVSSAGSQAYTVVINPAVTVSPLTLPDWTINKSGYSQTITSANGTGAHTLSVSSGSIPTGMTFTPATGLLDGTPTAAGTFNFTVTATDAVGATGSQAYTVVINEAIAVSPATLPNTTVNVAGYSQTITATGGTGAKTFAVTVGALPNGISLNSGSGAVTGTPSVAGTFNFTITATDTVGATGTKAYTVVVNSPPAIFANTGGGAPVIYGISNGYGNAANNQVYRIDPATGAISNAVQVTLAGFTITNSQALTAHPTTGVLYGVVQTSSPTARRLVTIDPATGVATQIGAFGSGLQFACLAFKADGTLIGVTGNTGTTPETLYTLSTVNASATLLLALGNGADGETIAFHPDGTLYHSSGNGDAFFESVNLNTNAVVTLGHAVGEMFAMGYYPPTSTMLGSDISSNLFSINLANGARTPIGHINSPDDNRGMAVVVPVATSLTRVAGVTSGINSQIATVSDAETAVGSLVVTATTVPAGLHVTNIVNTAGTITADVSADVGVADGAYTVVLNVFDGTDNATANLTVNVRVADLSITVTDGVSSATPGTTTTYTITAANVGTADITGATVADTFPAFLSGVTWTAVGAGGGTASASGNGNINDTVNLPVGGSVTYTVTAPILASATGTLSNTATVTSPLTDSVPGNNSATDTDTLTPQADLAITLTDGITAIGNGSGLTYTLTVSNAGPSNATGATVADTFPAALTNISWTGVGAGGGTGPASGNGNINTSAINLPAGGSFTFTIAATANSAASGPLSNTATIAAPGGVIDPNPANNSATDTDLLVHTPTVTNSATTVNTQSATGLVISRNAADGAEVTHFKITNITNGTLFQNNGTTAIAAGSFITFAQGNAGLKFTPTTNFIGVASFDVAAAVDGVGTGLSGTATAQIPVGTVNPTAVQQTQPVAGYKASVQTGLFEVPVDVTNTTAFPINGFRLHVNYNAYIGAHPSMKLSNATLIINPSDAYIDYPYPVAVNGKVVVTLKFYTSNRRFPNPFAPGVTVEKLTTAQAVQANPPAGSVPVSRTQMLTGGNFLVEFPAVVGHWYRISFSSNDLSHWFDSPFPIQAGATKVQWIDSGAPLTDSPPSSVTSRFYNVTEIPAPSVP